MSFLNIVQEICPSVFSLIINANCTCLPDEICLYLNFHYYGGQNKSYRTGKREFHPTDTWHCLKAINDLRFLLLNCEYMYIIRGKKIVKFSLVPRASKVKFLLVLLPITCPKYIVK